MMGIPFDILNCNAREQSNTVKSSTHMIETVTAPYHVWDFSLPSVRASVACVDIPGHTQNIDMGRCVSLSLSEKKGTIAIAHAAAAVIL